MNLMTVPNCRNNCVEHPVPPRTRISCDASEDTAAAFSKFRRMPIEISHKADEACGIVTAAILVRIAHFHSKGGRRPPRREQVILWKRPV